MVVSTLAPSGLSRGAPQTQWYLPFERLEELLSFAPVVVAGLAADQIRVVMDLEDLRPRLGQVRGLPLPGSPYFLRHVRDGWGAITFASATAGSVGDSAIGRARWVHVRWRT